MIFNPTRAQAEPEIKASKFLSLDIETKGLIFWMHKIVMLIITTDSGVTYIWDVRKEWPKWINKYLSSQDYVKIIQNGLFDCCFIEWQQGVQVRKIIDPSLQEQIIQGVHLDRKESNKNPKLKKLYSSALEFTLPRYELPAKKEALIPMPDGTMLSANLSFAKWPDNKPFHKLQLQYGAGDTEQLLDLVILQRDLLIDKKLLRVARLENECLEAFVQMRLNGIGFDESIWLDIADKYKQKAKPILKKLEALPGGKINWNSHQQVKKFFANRGIFIPTFKQMDKKFKGKDEVLDTFIYLRSIYYAIKTFGPGWLRKNDKKGRAPVIATDGRIHPDFIQIVSTGRGSCSDPNLQNLPNVAAKKTKIDSHRRAFISKPGHSFVISDFAGQEFALMMFMAQELEWLEHIRKHHDVHSIMSSKALGEMWDEETEKSCEFERTLKKCKCSGHLYLRDSTKKTTFGIAYGKGADQTAVDIESSVAFARKLINSIYREAPKLKALLKKNGQRGVNYGECRTLPPYNRLRTLIEDRPSMMWHVRNQAINSPIQGAGGDMIKQAMVFIHREIFNKGWYEKGARLILWIHDEVITEVKDKYAEAWSKVVAECMERAGAIITNGERLIAAEISIKKNIDK